MKTASTLAALAVALACCSPAFAQYPAAAVASVHPAAEFTDGLVRKVDKDARKLTIKHGEIKNLDMPPMTMVFGVAKPAFVDQVKAGDKIRFKAVDEGGGKLTITEIQPAH